jgi:hypothetical protein
MQIASGGGDPAVLSALQSESQRLGADYRTIIQRKMQADESAKEREFKKSERIASESFELGKEKIKADAGKDKSPTVKFAVQKDKNGNIINGVVLNVPKNAPSFTLQEVDPRLKSEDGWEFSDTGEQVSKMQKGEKLSSSGANNILEGMFKLPDKNGIIGPNIPDANVPRYTAAVKLLGDYLKTEPNETTAANRAYEDIVNAEIFYWDELSRDIQAAGLKNPKAIEMYENELAEEFMEDFGYRPNRANLDSLRRMKGIIIK